MYDALKYGAIVLGVVSLGYAFRLLQQELKRPNVRREARGLLICFMVFSVILLGMGIYLELTKLGNDVEAAIKQEQATAGAKYQAQLVEIQKKHDAEINKLNSTWQTKETERNRVLTLVKEQILQIDSAIDTKVMLGNWYNLTTDQKSKMFEFTNRVCMNLHAIHDELGIIAFLRCELPLQ